MDAKIGGPDREVAMDLTLDGKEAEFLMRLLQRSQADLGREIHHTDHRAFKAALKEDEALTQCLLEKLKAPSVMGI